ncbi:hypothetical protein MST27_14170 [Pseudomonas sp. PS1]|uniref:Uncharacterized protein n=1 Tax=Stutzerimonas marianensis TaxID=2929513 RepID=A0A9X1W6J2_9GAMM|nr:hypothetical protein [Pseudomonas marianensis]MCJ0974519.1 hypothetical protein [Pseudomonas marianensis]
MDYSQSRQQPLVLADGYSYTEIFPAPDTPDMPGHSGLTIRIFHALFSPDGEGDCVSLQPATAAPSPLGPFSLADDA